MSDWNVIDDNNGTLNLSKTSSDGTRVYRVVQDVAPILDANKRLFNDTSGYSPSRDIRHVARIPLVVAEKWMRELGVNVLKKEDFEKVKALLNDPDNRFLRTSPGNI